MPDGDGTFRSDRLHLTFYFVIIGAVGRNSDRRHSVLFFGRGVSDFIVDKFMHGIKGRYLIIFVRLRRCLR